MPLSAPQSQRFEPGAELTLQGFIGLGRYLHAQAGITALELGVQDGTRPATTGTAWAESLGLRLQRPHDAAVGRGAFYAASPWIDADALYVRTGGLDRAGLAVGGGLSFPLGARRYFWMGPFVRYLQIIEPNRAGFDSADARLLFVGLNLQIGTSPLARPVASEPLPAAPAPCPACPPVAANLPDRDGDGVSDAMDNCPDVAGPAQNGGCPIYKKVIVKPDKLELREKILFAFDRADIDPESYPLLDEVAQALKDNKGFRVQIEGHTDSRGTEAHNQALSEQRAQSVLTYLRDHGIAADRLSYKGFGEGAPTDTNDTVAGRENNRRVDFAVQFKIIDRSGQ